MCISKPVPRQPSSNCTETGMLRRLVGEEAEKYWMPVDLSMHCFDSLSSTTYLQASERGGGEVLDAGGPVRGRR